MTDRHLEPAEPRDYEAEDAEADTKYNDDADAWRKGES